MSGSLIVGRGIPEALGSPPTSIVWTPAPGMLKWIASLVPYVPGTWFEMSGSPRSLPALIDVIASRSETDPSPGVMSSAVVVTVTVAACAEPAQPIATRSAIAMASDLLWGYAAAIGSKTKR